MMSEVAPMMADQKFIFIETEWEYCSTLLDVNTVIQTNEHRNFRKAPNIN